MPNQELPTGITPEQLDAYERRLAARESAAANPLPGPLKFAFASDPVVVCGIPLRPVMLGDAILLEQLGNPLHRILGMAAPSEDPKFTLDQLIELIYLWSLPYAEGRDLVNPQPSTLNPQPNSPSFRALARQWAATQEWPLGVATLLGDAVRLNLERSMATAISYEPDHPNPDGTVFTVPPARPKTASAGG